MSPETFTEEAVAALRASSLASGLTSAQLREQAGEGDADLREGLVDALVAHYEEVPDEAVRDGFFVHDWKFGPEVVDALNARVGSSPTLRTTKWSARRTTENGYSETVIDFSAAFPDGTELSWVVRSLDDVVAAFNSASHKTGDPRVFVSLRTGGDFHAYLLADMKRVDALFRFLPFE